MNEPTPRGRDRLSLRRAWGMEQLAPWPAGSDEDEDAFVRWSRMLTVNYALLTTSMTMVALFLWWALDVFVLPDPQHMAVFSHLRSMSLLLLAAALAGFAFSSFVQRHVLAAGPMVATALGWIIGSSIGQLGPDGVVWYANALLVAVPIAMVPLPLGWRALATAPTCAALATGWLFASPANTDSPFARGELSFTLFVWVFTMVMGELFYRTVRRSFFQQRAIDRTRREVARINSSLSERVDAQTRELRQLAHRLQNAQESERKHLSRELHDELGQDLTAIRLTLSLLVQRFASEPASLGPLLDQMKELVSRATATTRMIVEGLRPKVVEDLGLIAGANWLCRTLQGSSGVPCEIIAEPGSDVGLDPDHAIALFRVLQESMNNALKHASPSHIRVEIATRDLELTVAVTDDGCGFNPDQPARGLGMVGMRERVRACGGRLDVTSAPGQGSTVLASIPTQPPRVFRTDEE